jgi:hypothetical protein
VAGVAAAGVAAAAAPQPDLTACVEKWNTAPLGSGRRLINGEAVAGRAALMVRFSDGSCGVAFSHRHGQVGGGWGVYVQVLHGDYAWTLNPQDPDAATGANQDALLSLADHGTNVRVLAPSGRLAAVPGGAIATVGFPAAGNASDDCRTIFVPGGANTYRATRTRTSCATTRELAFAYLDIEGRPVRGHPGERTIMGWRCTGAPAPERTASPSPTRRLTCSKRRRAVVLRVVPPHIRTSLPPGP